MRESLTVASASSSTHCNHYFSTGLFAARDIIDHSRALRETMPVPESASPSSAPPRPLVVRRRGDEIEVTHRGWAVLIEDDRITSLGNENVSIFTRSCTKPFQALACVLSGAADRYQLPENALAMACASHNGHVRHRELAIDVLSRGGLSEAALLCGASDPYGTAERIVYIQNSGQPRPGIHNCSGKHASFLLTQLHLGGRPEDYLKPDSVLQSRVRELVALSLDETGDSLGSFVDGCSAPTFRPRLVSLARGFQRLANPSMAAEEIAPALERLFSAVIQHPFYHSGHGRLCHAILRASGGRVIPKNGADGVYAFGVRGARAGFAVKVEDGADRGYELFTVQLLAKRGWIDPNHPEIRPFLNRNIYNAAGLKVGSIEASGFPQA